MKINAYSYNRLVKSNSPCEINVELDVPPMLINNKTYLPVRALAEALFCEVEWDNINRSVYINKIGGANRRIGSRSAGQRSKIMIETENKDQAGLMDLYGNWIIPMQATPSAEEVFYRTDLLELLNDIDYGAIDIARDGGWSSWDYRVYVYDSEEAKNNHSVPILMANYALDGTIHYIDYRVYDRDGSYTTYLMNEDEYLSGEKSLKDSLYKFSFDDVGNRKRLYYNEDGSYKGTYHYPN